MTVHDLIKTALENGYDNFADYQRVNFFNNNILGEYFSFTGVILDVNSGYIDSWGNMSYSNVGVSFKDNFIGKKCVEVTYSFNITHTSFETFKLLKSMIGQTVEDKISIHSFVLAGKFCSVSASSNNSFGFEKIIKEEIEKNRIAAENYRIAEQTQRQNALKQYENDKRRDSATYRNLTIGFLILLWLVIFLVRC